MFQSIAHTCGNGPAALQHPIKSLRRTLTALASGAIISAGGLMYQAPLYFRTPAPVSY